MARPGVFIHPAPTWCVWGCLSSGIALGERMNDALAIHSQSFPERFFLLLSDALGSASWSLREAPSLSLRQWLEVG